MMYRLPILIFILVAVGRLDAVAQERRWLSYEPEAVELRGRLILQWKYGPPNYGEDPKTDSKGRVPILVLTAPVNVRGKPGDEINNESVRGIRRIQLVSDPARYRHLIGKDVVVTGTLFHAHTGHHYTDVLITVSSIEVSSRKQHKRHK